MLYNALSAFDCSSLYNEISVDAAVVRLNVAVTQVTLSGVPPGYTIKHEYPAWNS
jgi:hypothetical protein